MILDLPTRKEENDQPHINAFSDMLTQRATFLCNSQHFCAINDICTQPVAYSSIENRKNLYNTHRTGLLAVFE